MQTSALKGELELLKTLINTSAALISSKITDLNTKVDQLEAQLVAAGTLDVDTIAALDSLKVAVAALTAISSSTVPVTS